jgi:site-specific recombinase XerD
MIVVDRKKHLTPNTKKLRFPVHQPEGWAACRSQFFRLFRAIASEAGLPAEKQHPHALKHSIASHLVSANVNLALVKQQLGHKSINSTMRYITTSDQQASKATASALMKIF